jgi:hypothetical protein
MLFAALRESGCGPSRPRRPPAFVSVIASIAAGPAVLSARQFMTHCDIRYKISVQCSMCGSVEAILTCECSIFWRLFFEAQPVD